MSMTPLEQLEHYAFQYYGIDWLVTLFVLLGVYLLGNKKRDGFLAGAIASAFGIVFSFQIQSIPNGITSFLLLTLYLRDYSRWKR